LLQIPVRRSNISESPTFSGGVRHLGMPTKLVGVLRRVGTEKFLVFQCDAKIADILG